MTTASLEAVFSDVDDTLIRGKSLIGFARFLQQTAPASDALEIAAGIDDVLVKLRTGVLPRPEINRLLYGTVLANRSVRHVLEAGRLWYQERAKDNRFYKAGVCRYLAGARARGAEVVLVSGSFSALLDPIAEHVGATSLLATQLETIGERYTGRLVGPIMIGAGKAMAVNAYAVAHALDLKRCAGIGDDVSDVPFLKLTGNVYVPEDADPSMLMLARDAGWRLLCD